MLAIQIRSRVAVSCFVLCAQDWVANVVAIILKMSKDILEPFDGKSVRAATFVQSTDGGQLDMPEELSKAFLAEVMHMQARLAQMSGRASSSTSHRIHRRHH